MSADDLQKVLLVVAAGLLGLVALGYLLPRPKAAVYAYLFGICFIPVWLGANLVNLITAHMALALVCVASLLFGGRKDADYLRGADLGVTDVRLFDVVLIVLAVFAAGCYAIGLVDLGQVYLIGTWGLMYLAGRLAALRMGIERISHALVWMLAVVAVLALVEFVTGYNLWLRFTGNSTGAFAVWGTQQFRGSFVRAEGAFGHSIALGACLAIGIPLVTATRLRAWVQFALIGLMALALVVTYSRTGFVAAGLGLALVLVCARGRITRAVRVGLGVCLVLAVPVGFLATSEAFSENSDVSTDAALYRLWLWDLVPGLRPVGRSDLMYRATDGTNSVGSFGSIDSAVLLHALSNGWIPALILCAAFTVAAIRLLVRGGDAALVAIVAQIPAFFTVALITQYAHLLWFVAGMAVTGLGQKPPVSARVGLAAAEEPRRLAAVA